MLKRFLNITGATAKRAKSPKSNRLDQDSASLDDVNSCKVVPALMATKEGGATPKNVPTKNGTSGTLITGEVMLMNQFGKNGVILKKII